jgi:hypothetical protein
MRSRDRPGRRVLPAIAAAVIGALLGLEFSGFILEGAAETAPAYATSVFGLSTIVLWGLIGGIAYSPLLRFPPSPPTLAGLVWTGGGRGAAAGLAAVLACAVSWWLLGLDGPNHRELFDVRDAWQWLETLGGFSLTGFFLGAAFAAIAGRAP